MPYKKKTRLPRTAVVGTVSTRSTRRESIVNIEIPKTRSKRGRKGGKVQGIQTVSIPIVTTDDDGDQILTEEVAIETVIALNDNPITSFDTASESSEVVAAKPQSVQELLKEWSDDESQEDKEESVNSSDEIDNYNAEVIDIEKRQVCKDVPVQEIIISHEVEVEGSLQKENKSTNSDSCDKLNEPYEQSEVQCEENLTVDINEFSDVKKQLENPIVDHPKLTANDSQLEKTENVTADLNQEHITTDLQMENKNLTEKPSSVNLEEETINSDSNICTSTTEDDEATMEISENTEIVNEFIVSEEAEVIIEDNSYVNEQEECNVIGPMEVLVENEDKPKRVRTMGEKKSYSDVPVDVQDKDEVKSEEFGNITSGEDHKNDVEIEEKSELIKDENPVTFVKEEGVKLEENNEDEKSSTLKCEFSEQDFKEASNEVEQANEKDLEQKVAELHLKDSDAPLEIDVTERVANLNLDSGELKSTESLEEILSDNFSSDKTSEKGPEKETTKNKKLKATKAPAKSVRSRKAKSGDAKLAKTQKTKATSKERKPRIPKQRTPKKEKIPKTTEVKEPKPKEKKIIVKVIKEPKSKKITASKKTKENQDSKPDDGLRKLSKGELNFDLEDVEVRRSSRIKSIYVQNKKTTGRGLVKQKSELSINDADMSDSSSTIVESEKGTPSTSPKTPSKERKTRWSKPIENLENRSENFAMNQDINFLIDNKPKMANDPVVVERLKQFVHLKENLYKTDRFTCKEAKKMTCDCFLTTDEIQADEYGCGEDCLNRLLMIECGDLCQVGDRCTNKRFQKAQFAPVEVFNTEKKGLGLRAAANIPFGEFILEYVGEVLDTDEFDNRAKVYSQDKNIHYYFMALRADAIIDATAKGNISRFINHSCDPNAETQKWTVNGELRIGFFSTRTILAGEEITFDYQFQRYGKEAQKCYCETAVCRGWLGEQPDSEDEDEEDDEEEEEEEEDEEIKTDENAAEVKVEISEDIQKIASEDTLKTEEIISEDAKGESDVTTSETIVTPAAVKKVKKKVQKQKKKKNRIELFEEIDQLNEEIEMLITTGLKNQAHTLKLSRLMVRAQDPQQRQKILKVLRRGDLPCRRLFLDYHGLRLMHGYLIDAQHLVKTDKSFESLRLEMLQTLAVLPIPNKTMLKDSKVLSTVEKWATDKALSSPDSDSNSPKPESDSVEIKKESAPIQTAGAPIQTAGAPIQTAGAPLERSIEDQEEEIRFLANKLIEEWSNLKEVFRIPKKERIEQMKEHEREANRKFMQMSYGLEDKDKKSDRYRSLSKVKEKEKTPKVFKGEKYSAEFLKLSKFERRKLFALQHELKEEERRLKQREMWRQHEINCMLIGADPRFTAPFDPSKPCQLIWNPQLGQWQSFPQNPLLNRQPNLQNMNIHLPHMPNAPSFPFSSPINVTANIPQAPPNVPPPNVLPPVLTSQGPLQIPPSNIPPQAAYPNIQTPLQQNLPITNPISLAQYQEQKLKEDDPSQVKFMGPIPPPARLPPKWKCAKDKYGRPYYYHIKIRKSQWEPPPFIDPTVKETPIESSESESSTDTSSISSDSSSDTSDSEEDIDDTKLLMEVRKQMEKTIKTPIKPPSPEPIEDESLIPTPSPDDKTMEDSEPDADQDFHETVSYGDDEEERPSIDIRLKEQFKLLNDDQPLKKKRRLGLCEEIIIPPRTEEDILRSKEDLKRYKANKEKVRKQKELLLKKREVDTKKVKKVRTSLKAKVKDMPEFNSEAARKIKETFKSNMASTVVTSLNFYRKPDCKEGKITNTEDFKHLARKLTHFVMLKEMKHIARIEDLQCTDNVKVKAREYIKKYMSKFGEVYVKRCDSPDFKD